MPTRESLREELLGLIESHQEGFASGTPESQRIDALIDELSTCTRYPRALDHPEVYRGNWIAAYHSMGRLVGGDGATGQGAGATSSLKVFSMGRLPDIPARFLGNGLEIDPETSAYNFTSRLELGERRVPALQYMLATYRRREENLDRFFVEFQGLATVPADPAMSMPEFAAAVGVGDPSLLACELKPPTKLWSHVAYMDDDLRIQLGQLGGHYVMRRTGLPMYSLEAQRSGKIGVLASGRS
jgi:hypothetical protein